MMMLLIGIKMSFIKYPMRPITTNPTEQAVRIFMYSTSKAYASLTFLVRLSAFV